MHMTRIPDYVGVSALGIKMGVIVPGSDILQLAYNALAKCHADNLLDSGDTVCITESVVARAQGNYVTTNTIARELRELLNLQPNGRLGALFPILSRNRFSLILKAFAMAVPEGEVVVQLSYPTDEVGNQLMPVEMVEKLGKDAEKDIIYPEELGEPRPRHPITGVDYIELYEDIIRQQGCKPTIIISNDPLAIVNYKLDGVVVASVHNRDSMLSKLKNAGQKAITLQEVCSSNAQTAWSEWGLLGSNMSSDDKLKLAPREANDLAVALQGKVATDLGKDIEVLVYGDGAYHDPSTGIYELYDPQPVFGMTQGLVGKYRRGLKYKYLVDKMWYKGSKIAEIESTLIAKQKMQGNRDNMETEGTCPYKVEDLIATLADLISGLADAGTPMVLVKNFKM